MGLNVWGAAKVLVAGVFVTLGVMVAYFVLALIVALLIFHFLPAPAAD